MSEDESKEPEESEGLSQEDKEFLDAVREFPDEYQDQTSDFHRKIIDRILHDKSELQNTTDRIEEEREKDNTELEK